MTSAQFTGLVRLVRDVARCDLHRGDRGVVQSAWFAPAEAYEVEFRVAGETYPVRVILQADEIAPEDESTPRLSLA